MASKISPFSVEILFLYEIFLLSLGKCSIVSGEAVRLLDTGSTYGLWDKDAIPYYIDPAYNETESSLIRTAVSHVMRETNYCVTFAEVSPFSPVYKIHITPLTGNSKGSPPHALCFTSPGISPETRKFADEQILSIARGPQGCLDAPRALRSIMRLLVLVLGRRNEHQRFDRDEFITLHPESIAHPAAYSRYGTGQAFWNLFPYDYCSITHNLPDDYAKPGTKAFTLAKSAPLGSIPKTDHLSLSDCKLISLLYGCDPSKCVQKPQCNDDAVGTSQATNMPTSSPLPPTSTTSQTTFSTTATALTLTNNTITSESGNSTLSTNLINPANTALTPSKNALGNGPSIFATGSTATAGSAAFLANTTETNPTSFIS